MDRILHSTRSANTFEHTPRVCKKRIYEFCIDSVKQTRSYVHYDWVLSNIMIDGDNIYLVDWDNVGLYEEKEIMDKMYSDLRALFGEKFDEMLPHPWHSILVRFNGDIVTDGSVLKRYGNVLETS